MKGFNSLRDTEEKISTGMYELVCKRGKYPPPSSRKILHYLVTHKGGRGWRSGKPPD